MRWQCCYISVVSAQAFWVTQQAATTASTKYCENVILVYVRAAINQGGPSSGETCFLPPSPTTNSSLVSVDLPCLDQTALPVWVVITAVGSRHGRSSVTRGEFVIEERGTTLVSSPKGPPLTNRCTCTKIVISVFKLEALQGGRFVCHRKTFERL